jgi:hypothetical protein
LKKFNSNARNCFYCLRIYRWGFNAKSLEYSIFTEADSFEGLKGAVKEAVLFHFDDE